MNFVNAIVVGIVSFFVLLLVFWYAVEIRADEDVAVRDVEATWDDARHLRFTGVVDNPRRSDVEVESLDVRLLVGERELGEARVLVGQTVGAGDRLELNWTVELPPDAGARWYEGVARKAGDATARLEGTLNVTRGGEAAAVRVRWESDGRLDPSDAMDTLSSCPEPQRPVCVQDSEGGWKDGQLALVLRLKAGSEPALVHGGDVVLRWGGAEVARATLPRTMLEARESELVGVRFQPPRDALVAWFAAHVGRCETTPVTVDLAATVEHLPDGRDGGTATPHGTEVTEFRWSLKGQDIRTEVACQ